MTILSSVKTVVLKLKRTQEESITYRKNNLSHKLLVAVRRMLLILLCATIQADFFIVSDITDCPCSIPGRFEVEQ